jgi:RNA polymerase-binding transcription factor DksA
MESTASVDPGGPPRPGHEAVLAEAERVLDEVDRALARLDDGSYGSCEVCGDAVDDDALASAPTARTCRAHLPLTDRTQG